MGSAPEEELLMQHSWYGKLLKKPKNMYISTSLILNRHSTQYG